jgi:hypothetical protein
MDLFRSALAATTAVFFWLPVLALLIVARIFSVMGYSFDLVFLILGIISSAGWIVTLNTLRGISGHWYFGLPLAGVLVAVTANAAAAFAAVPSLVMPGDPFSLFLTGLGIALLLCLAPCTILVAIVFSSFREQRDLNIVTAILSGLVSMIPLGLLLEMVTFATGITSQQVFRHPFFEGVMILYGLGTTILGIMILMAASRSSVRDTIS